MDKREQLLRYRALMGDAKADAQARLAAAVRPCCGAPRDQPHAPACRNARRRRG